MMANRKIRIGVLGCANIAIRTMIPELHRHPDFELVAIASRNLDKAGPIAQQYGSKAVTYDRLVEHPGIDAVYVPLPTGLHSEWVTRFLAAGKHVLCEKSLGCSFSEVEQMVALARRNRLLLMENFQFRFHSQHAYVKPLLASGLLGDIRCFRASFGFPPFSDGAANIRYQKKLGGGALLDAGAYTLKATTFMLGNGFKVKAATLNMSQEFGVDIGGAIYLENGRGLVSETAFGFDNFYQCNYEIWGSKGKLTTKRAFTAPPGFSPEIIIETSEGVEVKTLLADDHFANLLSHFVSTLRSGDFESEYGECLAQSYLIDEVKRCAGEK